MMENELTRLQQENATLLASIEQLEKEGAALAGRLAGVGGEEARARAKEAQLHLQRQLTEAEKKIQQALRIQNIEQNQLPQLSDTKQTQNEMIESLQKELMKIRLCEAENEATIRELRTRIAELEQDKKSMHETVVDNSVAHLQEELIAVKLREAEATLAMKELKQKVTEMSEAWMKHLQEHRQESRTAQSSSGVLSTPKKIIRAWENRGVDVQRQEEDLMTIRIREMESLAELQELRLKVMELESQVQVSTNQLRRQDEENKGMREEIEQSQQRLKDLGNKLKESEQKCIDTESKANYEQMLINIKFAEDSQKIAALKHEISVLQMRNQITITEDKLKNNEDKIERVQELHSKDL